MRCMDELDLETADIDDVVRLYSMEQDVIEHVEFVKPAFNQRLCESRCVDREIELTKYVGKSSNVVLMAVRQNDRRQVVSILFEEIEVRDGDVDTKRCFFRKTHSGIDDDHLITIPDAHAVHPEFTDTA